MSIFENDENEEPNNNFQRLNLNLKNLNNFLLKTNIQKHLLSNKIKKVKSIANKKANSFNIKKITNISRKKSIPFLQNNYSNDTNITKEINLKMGNINPILNKDNSKDKNINAKNKFNKIPVVRKKISKNRINNIIKNKKINYINKCKTNYSENNKHRKVLKNYIFQKNEKINKSARSFSYKINRKIDYLKKIDLCGKKLIEKQKIIKNNKIKENTIINNIKTKYLNFNPINKNTNINLIIITNTKNIFDRRNKSKFIKPNKIKRPQKYKLN